MLIERDKIKVERKKTKLVKVGDSLDGGRVAAIGTSEIRYIKSGNNLVLRIPEG